MFPPKKNVPAGKPSAPPFGKKPAKKGKKKPGPKTRQGAMDAIGQLGISGYGPND